MGAFTYKQNEAAPNAAYGYVLGATFAKVSSELCANVPPLIRAGLGLEVLSARASPFKARLQNG